MTTGAKKNQQLTDEEIARYAYYLWESEGCVHGRDMDYWLQAKAHLTMTSEHEAGLLKPSGSQPSTSKKPSEARTVAPAVDTNAKASKRRQTRPAREPIYA